MANKMIGAIMFVVGTSIGAGMLALPIATATLGFVGSLLLLFGCWFVMTAGAFCVLEANLWLPQNSNMISMAGATLGPLGKIIAWLSYCFLLYALLSAYISAGSDLLKYLLSLIDLIVPNAISATAFALLFGGIVFLGIRVVDYVNRGFMFAKFAAYVLLIIVLLPFVSIIHLGSGQIEQLTSPQAIMVTITSFGFAIIIPSLRVLFEGDLVQLRKAILLGSLVPLVCYVLWDLVIMGVIPLTGEHGLLRVAQAQGSTSAMVQALTIRADSGLVWYLTKIFTSVCVVTSFLGVALCMMDFTSDALQLEKIGVNRWLLAAISFLPPLVLVILFPHVFIKALAYAGIDCVLLLILLPALMVYIGRYKKKLISGWSVAGGKYLLLLLIGISVLLIANTML